MPRVSVTNNMDLKGLKNGAAASPVFDLVTCVSVMALEGTRHA